VPQAQQVAVQQPSPLPQQVQQYPSVQSSQSNGSSPLPPTANPQYPPGVKVINQAQHSNLGGDSHVSMPPPPQQQHTSEPVARPTSTAGALPPRNGPASFPGMSDLVVSFENAKQKGILGLANVFFEFDSLCLFDHLSWRADVRLRSSSQGARLWVLKCTHAAGHGEVSPYSRAKFS
jgi:hypothetical protein